MDGLWMDDTLKCEIWHAAADNDEEGRWGSVGVPPLSESELLILTLENCEGGAEEDEDH